MRFTWLIALLGLGLVLSIVEAGEHGKGKDKGKDKGYEEAVEGDTDEAASAEEKAKLAEKKAKEEEEKAKEQKERAEKFREFAEKEREKARKEREKAEREIEEAEKEKEKEANDKAEKERKLAEKERKKGEKEHPPGWDKGKKKGWEDEYPPGWDKKSDKEKAKWKADVDDAKDQVGKEADNRGVTAEEKQGLKEAVERMCRKGRDVKEAAGVVIEQIKKGKNALEILKENGIVIEIGG